MYPTHALLRRPPVSQDGLCHYISAAFEADADAAKAIRTKVRGKPFAIVHRNNRLDVIMLLARPVEASEGLQLAHHLGACIDLPLIAVAPSPSFPPQWSAPRLTVRDRIRIDLAVGGAVDMMSLPAHPAESSFTGVFVINSAGTMTYAGGVS